MKSIIATHSAPPRHWVGDGFPVRSLFSYHDRPERITPFLLLDHAGPMEFPPAERPRGVGVHPHRGFETVTIVYAGEVAHRDSTGAGGTIGPGDVQWMTAASGILHEEFHSEAFTRAGGTLEMVQLWVNLPARDKAAPPAYQTITAADIPRVELPADAGSLRVIAGEYGDCKGPATTRTPMNVWDVELVAGREATLQLPEGQSLLLVVLAGALRVNGDSDVSSGQYAEFERDGTDIRVSAAEDSKLLLLGGEPIDEPVVGYGPFVMNSADEIRAAIDDFNGGRFGQLQAAGH